jgi:hypothetical protein
MSIKNRFQMQKLKNIAFLLFLTVNLNAQPDENPKYEVISYMINHFLTNNKCDYFYPKKPEKPDVSITDTIIQFDAETYEEIIISPENYPIKFLPKYQLEYEKEAILWENKENLDEKVVIIAGNYKHSDSPDFDSMDSIGFEDLIKTLINANLINCDVSKITNNTEYFLSNSSEEENQLLKYSIVAYFWFSDVILNKEKTKAVVDFGFHFMNESDKFPYGFGGILCLTQDEKGWEVIKGLSSWEE